MHLDFSQICMGTKKIIQDLIHFLLYGQIGPIIESESLTQGPLIL